MSFNPSIAVRCCEIGWYSNIVLFRLILISLASTCYSGYVQAQEINTNTVIPTRVNSNVKTEVRLSPIASRSSSSSSSSLVKGPGVKFPEYICPKTDLGNFAQIFSIPCKSHAECLFLGTDQLCCKRSCRKGILAPPKEPQHRPVLGVSRMCPKEPVPEFLPVKKCQTDFDCEEERRVCCPDKDLKLYCRTAAPVWTQLPFPRTHAPLMSLIGYLQCQMAPPPVLDLFPQPCNRTIDCFPNLCCQEGSSKFCRPPKKSMLALVAQATQRFAKG
ncbi:uncharacterized protein LOC105685569 isoform X1 [Athalia rosae]|uniref:uncharacterized protein LOC105685569 isoform X1 n=1 Tax=Athalia rosae TaxID=37344 RepID=UPI0020349046|nr:uncharacterized protein LOC105685569 isoform X1 [Athalia rosae]